MIKNSFWTSITSVFAGLCCAGTPLMLAILTSIGLGFLINDFILFPIFFISLGFTIYFMRHNIKHHANTYPIMIAIFSGVVILAGIFIKPLVWFGIAGLLGSSIWDFILAKRGQK